MSYNECVQRCGSDYPPVRTVGRVSVHRLASFLRLHLNDDAELAGWMDEVGLKPDEPADILLAYAAVAMRVDTGEPTPSSTASP